MEWKDKTDIKPGDKVRAKPKNATQYYTGTALKLNGDKVLVELDKAQSQFKIRDMVIREWCLIPTTYKIRQ